MALQLLRWRLKWRCSIVTRLKNAGNKLLIKNLLQLGTIIAFEIEQGKDEYLNNIAAIITQKALQKSFTCGRRQYFVYNAPLLHYGNTITIY
jgi:hypothetical protein